MPAQVELSNEILNIETRDLTAKCNVRGSSHVTCSWAESGNFPIDMILHDTHQNSGGLGYIFLQETRSTADPGAEKVELSGISPIPTKIAGCVEPDVLGRLSVDCIPAGAASLLAAADARSCSLEAAYRAECRSSELKRQTASLLVGFWFFILWEFPQRAEWRDGVFLCSCPSSTTLINR